MLTRLLGRLLRLPLVIEHCARRQRKARAQAIITRYYNVYYTATVEPGVVRHGQMGVFFDNKQFDVREDGPDVEKLLNMDLGTKDAHIYAYDFIRSEVVQATGQVA